MTFEHLALHPRVLSGVRAMGFDTATPIQEKAIPPTLSGRDLIGLAQTGTGKTAAFALPIIHRLMEGPRGRVRALVLAPTRELADQIADHFRGLGRSSGLRCAAIYGGVGFAPQAGRLREGLEIVVACPGRLLDHLGQGTIDLSRIEVLVVDEADRMFDMGFLPDVRKILKKLPKRRQSLLFSATMPDDVRALVKELLHDPVTVQVDHGKPAATVAHAVYPVAGHLKTPLLLELLRSTDTESVIVFTKTKHRAKKVASNLVKAGHIATCLQGNLSQNRRREAIDGFRNGSFQIMVATDIAARGIDVTRISHVVNYDMPDTVDAYTHRIGRTGRLAKSGDAFTFVTHEDEDMIGAIEKILGERIERRTMEGFDYRAPAPEKLRQALPSRPAGPASASAHSRSQRRTAEPTRHARGRAR